MPKSKAQKQGVIEDLKNLLKKQSSLVFVDYKGIDVKSLGSLRAELKKIGAKLKVAKKTLLQKAIIEEKLTIDLKDMEGQLGVVFALQDALAPTKAVSAFAKAHQSFNILGGYFDNQLQGAEQVQILASLPSREALLGMLVGTLAAPLSGFLNVVGGNTKGLVVALAAIRDKKA
jgi:large subunit ribosomal protein L10